MSTTDYINPFKQAIMNRFHEVNADKGHTLPQAWLTPYLSQHAEHQACFEPAMQQLQAENLIEYQKTAEGGYHLMLTQQGEDTLYPDFHVTDAKQKIRRDIFAKFKANQDKTITDFWLSTYFGRLNPKEQRIFNDVVKGMLTENLVTASLLQSFYYLTEKGEHLMRESLV